MLNGQRSAFVAKMTLLDGKFAPIANGAFFMVYHGILVGCWSNPWSFKTGLVGGFKPTPLEKICSSKWVHLPHRIGVNINKYLSYHHVVFLVVFFWVSQTKIHQTLHPSLPNSFLRFLRWTVFDRYVFGGPVIPSHQEVFGCPGICKMPSMAHRYRF